MSAKTTARAILISALVLIPCGVLLADLATCVVISSGSGTDSATASVGIVGQPAVGFTSVGNVFMRVGGLRCFDVGVTCLPGDVDGNGLIDGDDIDDYVRVVTTGIGTPRELCASDLSVAEFTALLLGS